jgi:hypothetical protein
VGYTRQQQRIAHHIISVGQRRGESKKEILAALTTALVEANLGNPTMAHSDRDSAGWRQERSHYGPESKRRNVRSAARRFYNETSAEGDGKGMSIGELSQTVQRSAYPERYATREGQARDLLRAYNRGKLRHAKPGGKAGGRGGRGRGTHLEPDWTVLPGVDRSAERDDVRTSYLRTDRPPSVDELLEMAGKLQDLRDTPEERIMGVKEVPDRGGAGRAGSGRAGGGGGGGRGGAETDIRRIIRKAKSMGLTVRENALVDPVDPVHTEGSHHYRRTKFGPKTGAVDISGDPKKIKALYRYLARRKGPDLEELIYNGPGAGRANIKDGKRVGRGFYSGHDTHLHAADDD